MSKVTVKVTQTNQYFMLLPSGKVRLTDNKEEASRVEFETAFLFLQLDAMSSEQKTLGLEIEE